MWCRSHDGKILIECTEIRIEKTLGKHKYVIVGRGPGSTDLSQAALGMYITEKEALDEMNKLQDFMNDRGREIYSFKKIVE